MPLTRSILADPLNFAENVLGLDLWSRQKTAMKAILTSRRIAEADCHSSGKTLAAAALALWWAMRWPDARVVTLAPGWLLMKSVLWAEIHSLIQRSSTSCPRLRSARLRSSSDPKNLILGLSTNEITRLQGQHSEHLLVVVDEAPGFPEEQWPAVEGMLASGDGRLLMLGNPTIPSGPFYNAFNRARSAWKTFSASARFRLRTSKAFPISRRCSSCRIANWIITRVLSHHAAMGPRAL